MSFSFALGRLSLAGQLRSSGVTAPPVTVPPLTPATVTNPDPAPTVSITTSRAPSAAQYAPEAVHVKAVPANFLVSTPPTNSIAYDPEFHEIEYLWDFGDDGDTFAAPDNVRSIQRDANSAIGQIAAHVYRDPGTYTITCTAVRVSAAAPMVVELATSTTSVTVKDPDTIWTADNTIVVAHDGDFTGAPASNWQATEWGSNTTDTDHWVYMINRARMSEFGPARILFKRGGDYSGYSEGFSPRNNQGLHEYVFFGAWGTGAKPITSRTRVGELSGHSVTWHNIHFKNEYDDVAQTGALLPGIDLRFGGHALVTECEISNSDIGIVSNVVGNAAPATTVLHDTEMSSLARYGTFTNMRGENHDSAGGIDRLIWLGCKDVDSGAAPNFSGGTSAQKQGPIRSGGGEEVIISNCDFFCRFGWTGQGNWPDGMAATAVQSIVRIYAGGTPSTGNEQNGRVVVSRSSFEGNELFSIESLSDDKPGIGNILLDQNYHLGSALTQSFGRSRVGAFTFRNNLLVQPNSVADGYDIKNLFSLFPADKTVAFDEDQNKAEPIRFYCNTIVCFGTASLSQAAFFGADGFDSFTEANNVIYLANNTDATEHVDIAPNDSSTFFTPRYIGRLESADNGVLQTQYATPPGAASLFRPLEAAAPFEAVTALPVSYYDITGTHRGNAPDLGAVIAKRDPVTSQPEPSDPAVTGGTETVINDGGTYYRVHTFTADGTLTVNRDTDVEFLAIAGGGSGGRFRGGAGGAGGLLKYVAGEANNSQGSALALTAGSEAIVIGAGGAARSGGNTPGENGGNTTFAGLTLVGGGGGGSSEQQAGSAGGSGGGGRAWLGGAGGAGTAGQGNDGGAGNFQTSPEYSGGGGGAGGVGGQPNGGAGIDSSISGASVGYAGGGVGGNNGGTTGTATHGGGAFEADATPNTGGGGGGSNIGDSGAGGSGIVIVRYEITQAEYDAEV